MNERQKPPVAALAVPERTGTGYPEPFASRVRGRSRRRLGEWFGLRAFGVNLTCLAPGAGTALKHSHARQDEFVYVLEGCPVLEMGGTSFPLAPGDCVGFPAGAGEAHHLVNRSGADVWLLEVGSREADDVVVYPEDDLEAHPLPGGGWRFAPKGG